MNGRLVNTFVLTWIYDRGKHEAVAFDEGTDLYPTLGISWVQQQLGSATIGAFVMQRICPAYVTFTKLLPTAGYNFA